MEVVLAKVMAREMKEPYESKYEVLPELGPDVFWGECAMCLWDPRVADAIRSRMESHFEGVVAMRFMNDFGTRVWLPSNFPILTNPKFIQQVRGVGRIGHAEPLEDGNIAHNVRVLTTGEPDPSPEPFMLTDPRVEPNDMYTRDDIIEYAHAFHVPRLLAWLGEITCDLAIELKDSPNVITLIHTVVQDEKMASCNFLRILPRELIIFAAVHESQWSDYPGDPCEIKQSFPWFITGQCLAICDYRTGRQCPRMAMTNQSFCKWHGEVQVTMHVRPTKRAARDILPDEYSNRSLNLETYAQTKRFASAMTFAANPHEQPMVGFYLPVLRYEGLYHTYDPKYCGKFYFYEPESHLHLYLGNSRCYGSKVHAFVELSMVRYHKMPSLEEQCGSLKLHQMRSMGFNTFWSASRSQELCTLVSVITNSNHVRDAGILRCDTLRSATSDTAFWDEFILSRYWSVYLSQDDTPKTVEGLPVMFPTDNPQHLSVSIGEFDFLDQPICKLAQALNIDTIVFQHEIGSHDCVTEILDTRVDYKAQLYDLGSIVQISQTLRRYPKIWFPRDDGLVYVGPNAMRAEMSSHITDVFPSLYPPTSFQCTTHEGNLKRYQATLGGGPRAKDHAMELLQRLYPEEKLQELEERYQKDRIDYYRQEYLLFIRENKSNNAMRVLEILEPNVDHQKQVYKDMYDAHHKEWEQKYQVAVQSNDEREAILNMQNLEPELAMDVIRTKVQADIQAFAPDAYAQAIKQGNTSKAMLWLHTLHPTWMYKEIKAKVAEDLTL